MDKNKFLENKEICVEDDQNKVRIAFSELVHELDMVYGEDYVKVMKLV